MNKKRVPTITELILGNVFKKGDTFWTSDLKTILNLRHQRIGGLISAMSRRKFIRPLFQEGGDVCWEVI